MDEWLYAGSAPHYAVGRMPYPKELAGALRDELALDGRGRLLDVGCGPGSLTRLLAPLFEASVGIDADAAMIAQAASTGTAAVTWRQLRAEQLPADLGVFRVVTFAQSFHWMDRPTVAEAVRSMIASGGAWVHISATTHEGVPGDDRLRHPRPPRAEIDALIKRYLGPVRRAGRGLLPAGTPDGEAAVMRAAGYRGPVEFQVAGGEVIDRTEDEVVAAVFSLSYGAPHLFGPRLADFERELRGVLRRAAPDGRFAERTREVGVSVWRP